MTYVLLLGTLGPTDSKQPKHRRKGHSLETNGTVVIEPIKNTERRNTDYRDVTGTTIRRITTTAQLVNDKEHRQT